MSDIQRTYGITWQYRHRLAHVWPTPPPPDAYRFAGTEAAESLDAMLRLTPWYSRNNDKALSVEDELADCAMMLCTALGPDWTPAGVECVVDDSRIIVDYVFVMCGEALAEYHRGDADEAERTAERVLDLIAQYPGMDLPARVEQRLQRIEARVMGE